MREERRADADEYVGTQARRFTRDLALHADGAAKNRGEKQFEEQRKTQGVEPCIDRRPRCDGVLQQKEELREQRNYRAPCRGWSARVEIAHIS
jgi:hypothetical protein